MRNPRVRAIAAACIVALVSSCAHTDGARRRKPKRPWQAVFVSPVLGRGFERRKDNLLVAMRTVYRAGLKARVVFHDYTECRVLEYPADEKKIRSLRLIAPHGDLFGGIELAAETAGEGDFVVLNIDHLAPVGRRLPGKVARRFGKLSLVVAVAPDSGIYDDVVRPLRAIAGRFAWAASLDQAAAIITRELKGKKRDARARAL